jgi:hypothetical protein
MRNINSRKLVNPLAVTAPASAGNAALPLAAFAIDKKTDTPVRIIADGGRITLSVANLRSAVAITAWSGAILDVDTDHRVLIRQADELGVLMSCPWRFGNGAAA